MVDPCEVEIVLAHPTVEVIHLRFEVSQRPGPRDAENLGNEDEPTHNGDDLLHLPPQGLLLRRPVIETSALDELTNTVAHDGLEQVLVDVLHNLEGACVQYHVRYSERVRQVDGAVDQQNDGDEHAWDQHHDAHYNLVDYPLALDHEHILPHIHVRLDLAFLRVVQPDDGQADLADAADLRGHGEDPDEHRDRTDVLARDQDSAQSWLGRPVSCHVAVVSAQGIVHKSLAQVRGLRRDRLQIDVFPLVVGHEPLRKNTLLHRFIDGVHCHGGDQGEHEDELQEDRYEEE
mmetsp:Transcript_37752/g.108306  ORF Transcript_37752/g.108306 Transcript_37752/m.108306 type:complete len:289 (+) Transcript_37752:1117-1983(+)